MRMSIDVIKNANNPNNTVRIYAFQQFIEEMTYEATIALAKEVAKEIAGDIFKKNKKKILSSIDTTLMIEEIQKNLLEKIKAQTTPLPKEPK